MDSHPNLTDHFLIAMPSLADPNFSRTVTYLCEHNEDGALGIVVNRPSDLTLAELLGHMGLKADAGSLGRTPVYMGGPVQRERGFVLHPPEGDWESSMRISERVAVTTSRDILEAMADASGPSRYLIALGYAGWGPGQLEREMAENAWLSGPADPEIIYALDSERRWQAAANLLGVDLTLLSSETGHA